MDFFEGVLRRLVFYGAAAIAAGWALSALEVEVPGRVAGVVIGGVSFLTGLIQTLNLHLVAKLKSVRNGYRDSFWVRRRLKARISARESVAFTRMKVGIAFALVAFLAAMYMLFLDKEPVGAWLLGVTAAALLFSVVMIFLTLTEVSQLTDLERELEDKAITAEIKKEALRALRTPDNEEEKD